MELFKITLNNGQYYTILYVKAENEAQAKRLAIKRLKGSSSTLKWKKR